MNLKTIPNLASLNLKDLNKILPLAILEKIQDNYSTALEIPISIRNYNGELLTKFSNSSKLWQIILTKPEVEQQLVKNLQQAADKCLRTGQIVIFERTANAYTFIAPINAGSQVFAFFVGGMVRFGNPDLKIAEQQAQLLKIDLETYLDVFLSLPFFTRERLEASANLIKIIGNTISTLEAEESETKNRTTVIQQKNLELNQQLNVYKKIINSLDIGIFTATLDDLNITEINTIGQQILASTQTPETTQKSLQSLFHTKLQLSKFIQVIRDKQIIKDWLIQLKTIKGETKTISINANLITDPNNGKNLIHGQIKDLNQRPHSSI